MKIAYASTDGITINTKFCSSTIFYIYEKEGKESRFIDRRWISDAASLCGRSEYLDEFIEIVAAELKDCQVICAAKFSFESMRKLRKQGIKCLTSKGGRVVDNLPK